MESIKDILNFCNREIFFNYKELGCIQDFNAVRKFIINRFHQTIPHDRIIITLSRIDEMLLKIYNNETDNILIDIHNLSENIIYMISFEKTVKDEQVLDNYITIS